MLCSPSPHAQLDKDRKALLERKKVARAAEKGKGKVRRGQGLGLIRDGRVRLAAWMLWQSRSAYINPPARF